MLGKPKLMRRQNFGNHTISQIIQFLFYDFPSIPIIMVLEVLNILKEQIFRMVIFYDVTYIIEKIPSFLSVIKSLSFPCLTKGLAREPGTKNIMLRNLRRQNLSDVTNNFSIREIDLILSP